MSVSSPYFNPRAVRAAVACWTVIPLSEGTVASFRPVDTNSVTVEPTLTTEPPEGSARRTFPGACDEDSPLIEDLSPRRVRSSCAVNLILADQIVRDRDRRRGRRPGLVATDDAREREGGDRAGRQQQQEHEDPWPARAPWWRLPRGRRRDRRQLAVPHASAIARRLHPRIPDVGLGRHDARHLLRSRRQRDAATRSVEVGAPSPRPSGSGRPRPWPARAGRPARAPGGTPGATRVGGTGSSPRCFIATATAESPSNGTRPVSISYSTIADRVEVGRRARPPRRAPARARGTARCR